MALLTRNRPETAPVEFRLSADFTDIPAEIARQSESGPTPPGPLPLSGDNRYDWLARYAGWLFGLGNRTEAEVIEALCEENECACDPPLSRAEVKRIEVGVAKHYRDGGLDDA